MAGRFLLTLLILFLPVVTIGSQGKSSPKKNEIAWQKRLAQVLAIKNNEKAMQAILAEEGQLGRQENTFSKLCLAELLIRAKLPRVQGINKGVVATQAIGHLEKVLELEPENVLALYLHARTCAGLPTFFGKAPTATRSFQTLFEIEQRKPGSVPYPDVFASLAKIRQSQVVEALKVGRRAFPDNQELRRLEESRKANATNKQQPAPKPKPAATKQAPGKTHGSKTAFRNALLKGKMNFAQLDGQLAADALLHPEDHEYPVFRGVLRLWQLEIVRDAKHAMEAQVHLRHAMKLNPRDTRIFGWLGPVVFATGHAIGDKKMIAEGQRLLDEGVRTNPEQNLFARAFAYEITGTHANRLEADMYSMLSVCSEANPDRTRFIPGKRTNDHCACGNGPAAPHNLSGTYFWAGEIFRRSGDKQRAKDGYETALRKDVDKTWPFRALAKERLKLLNNRNLAVTPKPVSCMLCHQAE